MTTLIVATPYFNSNMSVEAYKLITRGGEKLVDMMDDYISVSDALMTPGLDLIKSLGVEPLSGTRRIKNVIIRSIVRFQGLERFGTKPAAGEKRVVGALGRLYAVEVGKQNLPDFV